MDLYDFYNTFITAVAADNGLHAWCRVKFDNDLTVLADLQSHALPTVDDMPYVIFHTPEAIKNQERRVNEYTLGVDVGLNKDALAVRAEDSVEQPAGIELILDFVTLLVGVVKDSLPSNTSFGYRLAADTLGSLPKIHGYIDFDFMEKVTIGTDPLA